MVVFSYQSNNKITNKFSISFSKQKLKSQTDKLINKIDE